MSEKRKLSEEQFDSLGAYHACEEFLLLLSLLEPLKDRLVAPG